MPAVGRPPIWQWRPGQERRRLEDGYLIPIRPGTMVDERPYSVIGFPLRPLDCQGS